MLGACGAGQARIEHGGKASEGEIIASNQDYVYLQTKRGKTVAIARRDVEVVRHPGEAQLVLDGALLTAGLGLVAIGTYVFANSPEDECPFLNWSEVPCDGPNALTNEVFGGLGVAVGAGLTTTAVLMLMKHMGAKERSESMMENTSPRIVPTFSVAPNAGTVGLQGRF